MNTFLIILLTLLIPEDSLLISEKTRVLGSIKDTAIKKGIPEEYLQNVFHEESIQIHKKIPERFASPYEKKTWEEYRKLFIKQSRIKKGKEFYTQHKDTLKNVSNEFGVDVFLILSIIGIESNYGRHHKSVTVFNSLFTQIVEMPKRAKWAKHELVELLTYCYNDSISPHTIFGSYAGAFGFGQFIPSSFNRYAVDFNKDGVRQPYAWPDVLASVANYLIKNGYPKNDYLNNKKVYKSVFAYNHSDNYVKAVLELRNELKKMIIENE